MKISQYFELQPYSLLPHKKELYFFKLIKEISKKHKKNSMYYKKFFNHIVKKKNIKKLSDLPYLTTNIFKEMEIKSIRDEKVFKVLNSSGTTGSNLSKIYLDKKNSENQIKILNKIVSSVIGKKRIPMIIIDKKPKLLNRKEFNAKYAAYNGFSIFGKNHTYILNENNEIDYPMLNSFLNKYGSEKFLLFGFTYLVYTNLFTKLNLNKIKMNFKNGILLHGGGWKKLNKIKVSNKEFRNQIKRKIGLKKIINYYGMVEQTGSIFLECDKCSSFVTSIYSDIIIRDKYLNEIKDNKIGFIQSLSLLPSSYPGHSILTEDLGKLINNNCSCKKKGKRFLVLGRTEKSEIRGCSDV